MKKYCSLLTLLVLLCNASFCQDLEFPTDAPVWKESHTTIAGPNDRYFTVCGDTMIDGTLYDRLLEIFVDGNLQITQKVTLGGIRQEGSKVFLQYIGDTNEFLLFDFSLQQGDSITLEMPFGMQPAVRKVTSATTEMIEGKIRRVIQFEEDFIDCPYEPEKWIEGIGSTYGLTTRGFSPCGGVDIGSFLLCFQYFDEYVNFTLIECFLPQSTAVACGANSTKTPVIIYEPLSVSPNPAPSSQFTFNMSQDLEMKNFNLNVYAANGKVVRTIENLTTNTPWPSDTPLAKGFYFAILENKESGRISGHTTFVVQ